MKKTSTPKNSLQLKVRSHKLSINIAKPGKKLSELIGVYDDLEDTLKKLKTRSLLSGENPLMQINIKQLINQLSKSKRKIERKITHALINDSAEFVKKLDKWSPKLGRKSTSRRKRATSSEIGKN